MNDQVFYYRVGEIMLVLSLVLFVQQSKYEEDKIIIQTLGEYEI